MNSNAVNLPLIFGLDLYVRPVFKSISDIHQDVACNGCSLRFVALHGVGQYIWISSLIIASIIHESMLEHVPLQN